MKIAQVSPLYESCPPRLYGGTERIVYYLTEELIRLGHEVTLFASGDSQTSAVLEAPCAQALRLGEARKDPLIYHITMLHRLRRRAAEFDIIHFHTEYLHFPLFADYADKTLTTLHGRLDPPDLPVIMREFPMMPLVSISDAQQTPLCWANWIGKVLHGLPRDLFRSFELRNFLNLFGMQRLERRVANAGDGFVRQAAQECRGTQDRLN